MIFRFLWVLDIYESWIFGHRTVRFGRWTIHTRMGSGNLIRYFVSFRSSVHGPISEPDSDLMVCINVQLEFFTSKIPAKFRAKIGVLDHIIMKSRSKIHCLYENKQTVEWTMLIYVRYLSDIWPSRAKYQISSFNHVKGSLSIHWKFNRSNGPIQNDQFGERKWFRQ